MKECEQCVIHSNSPSIVATGLPCPCPCPCPGPWTLPDRVAASLLKERHWSGDNDWCCQAISAAPRPGSLPAQIALNTHLWQTHLGVVTLFLWEHIIILYGSEITFLIAQAAMRNLSAFIRSKGMKFGICAQPRRVPLSYSSPEPRCPIC